MSFALQVMRRATFTLLKNQLYIVLVVAIISYFIYDLAVFFAALYGGFIALSATMISSLRITRAGLIASTERLQGNIEIYIGAIQKYLLVLALFALGMGFFNLLPLPMIITFSFTQFGYLFINVNTKNNGVSS